MKKIYHLLILIFLCNYILSIEPTKFQDGKIFPIDQDIPGTNEYKTKAMTFQASDTVNYFQYDFGIGIPSSDIAAFRLDITPYSTAMDGYKVHCANLQSTASDDELKAALNEVKADETKSTCLHLRQNRGYLNSILKLDKTKTKIGIAIYIKADETPQININLRIAEKVLGTDEFEPQINEQYSMVPITIDIPKFRETLKSKILFYSSTRSLHMYEATSSGYSPNKLFSGNILNVYTNPNMVRQKYHNATIMTLIANPLGFANDEKFVFQMTLLDSDFLLDYYVSSNLNGRPINSPLLINMTTCDNPYYVILNYNAHDNDKILILDEIYGKLSYLGVATNLEQETWEEMLEKDIKTVDLNDKRYKLPISATNIDVYKIQCTLPIMLNFYYVPEESTVYTMKEGDIQIFNLDPYQTISIPLIQGIKRPEILIEVNQPENSPYVIIKVDEEKVYTSNTLEKFKPMSLDGDIIIRERKGSSNTRVIVKIAYPESMWKDHSPYIKYNPEEKVYLFEFPNDAENKDFYTFANLTMNGENADDNVKFCFTSSIGGALKVSAENCYRVSKTNSYSLKFFNPLIAYKNYEYSDDLKYSVTIMPFTDVTSFTINVDIHTYNTKVRLKEGINNKVSMPDTGEFSAVLTPPQIETSSIFLQVQVCDVDNGIKIRIADILKDKDIISQRTINPGETNTYVLFENPLMDSVFYSWSKEGANVFLRLVGLSTTVEPKFKDIRVYFDQDTNLFYIEAPLDSKEDYKITLLIDDENKLKEKKYTLCSFVDTSFDKLAKYHQTITVENGDTAFMLANFHKAGFEPGNKFDSLVYFEQLSKGQMAFLSEVVQGTVGEISIESIYPLNTTYEKDESYYYTTVEEEFNYYYYFSYLPENKLDVPFGAFSIELDPESIGIFMGVYCTFVDADADPMTMVEEVGNIVFDEEKSSCIGAQSSLNALRYNYIFKYAYQEDGTPKKMVILIINDNFEGSFNVYMKKDQGEEIIKTDFDTQQEYGENESNKKSIIPYIVDLKKIRGKNTDNDDDDNDNDNDDGDYISKVLFYSKNLELQMYYISDDHYAPVKLFSGNIALVFTNPQLAIQKYHSDKLILITENIEGKTHPSIGGSFRFHTKMFHSNSTLEYFVSQNPVGRTLNFPLSLEMLTCSKNHSKAYYLLNYNEAEPERTLHLDMIYGNYIRARIATEINQEHWDDLLKDTKSMKEITDYQSKLSEKSQHIDIIEVECETPLLINAYYTKDDYYYVDMDLGGVVIKLIPGQDIFTFSFKILEKTTLEYTVSLYNSKESPDVTLSTSDGETIHIFGNVLQQGKMYSIPQSITVLNNVKTATRFIFKFGFGVEDNWHKETFPGIKGEVYFNYTSKVYKFPTESDKYDYKNVDIKVNAINDNPNTKFCYSTSLGTSIDTSRENCFRTGRYIPYTLSFINPLIMGKNYKTNIDSYYITIRPYNYYEDISIEITEIKYDIKNRNELGKAKQLTISGNTVSSILTIPEEPMNVIFQLKSCEKHNEPIQYILSNAYSKDELHRGKIYYKDKYGIYYISELTYMENQIELKGENVKMFTKHAGISSTYSPEINENYTVSFDQDSSALNIIKPILGEVFNFKVIVHKESLDSLSQCDVAFNDLSKYDYVKSFESTSSDRIIHHIDFSSIGYQKGTKFWALVYAEQMLNSKLEFLYQVITGEVGEGTGTIKIDKTIEGEQDYLEANFKVKLSSNYLYYDFTRAPLGNVASIRINTNTATVNKVGCVFVSTDATPDQMINEVNKAVMEGKSVCVGDNYAGNNGFDALINAKYPSDKNRLVIQVLYKLGSENDEDSDGSIIIKNKGTDLSEQGKYPSEEPHSAIPYVIDLLKIRGSSTKDYVSKILFYSNTREMQMFYITEKDPKPVTLFTGNIMMVYTNEELIKQKYQGATVMILLTDALSDIERHSIGEQYRFITYFFKSEVNIQYFLSSNEEGRPLNNPTTIEMTSCNQPYYYIMNYNKVEKKRKLHIDTIFGEKKAIKIAKSLNEPSWDELIENMQPITADEIVLEEQIRFHFDVIQVTCNVPILLNLFYTDPENSKTTNLETGDITVLSLAKGEKKDLTFKMGEQGPFHYSFTVEKNSKIKPRLNITFNGKNPMDIQDNGVYTKYWVAQYSKIEIKNEELSGNINTRVIFKFGIGIESIYSKDEKGIYSNVNDTKREYNLYGYIYDQSPSKLNYTGVDFEVSTTEDNVKFCYSTNLGTYIFPSLQNCFRVGKNNPYTISTLNPYVMHKNYTFDQYISYYVGFRTLDKNHNIIITPNPIKYDTTERNIEGRKNKVKISGDLDEISTILTAPENHENYIFVETCLCTKKAHVSYQFLNAYNHSNLGSDGQLNNNKIKITVLENPKLDTELRIFNGKNGNEVFVKHFGYDNAKHTKPTPPSPTTIAISYNYETHVLNWTQPLKKEKFEYQIYIDKIGVIRKQNYTLCHVAEVTKLGHHKELLTTDSETPNITIDFSQPDLGPDYGDFDIIIVAEQIDNQKFTFLSPTYNSKGEHDEDEPDDSSDVQPTDEPKPESKTGLIVIISILSVVIIGGGIAGVLIFMKYRKKAQIIEQNKQTSMALLNSTKQDKLVESQVQVDP